MKTTMEGNKKMDRKLRAFSALAGVFALAGASLAIPAFTAPEEAAAAPPTSNNAPIVNLFQWNWDSVGKECEALAENGVNAVQISVPTEHVVVAGNPWWQDYQPVSYKFDSRRGTEEQLRNAISTCNSAGVEVIADVVLNHMAGTSGDPTEVKTGYAGSQYQNLAYPEIPWVESDFHEPCEITDWMDRDQVRRCQTGTGADLKTEDAQVRATMREQLIEPLLDMGVAGFRVDAAKHMEPEDITDILGGAYAYQEVVTGPNNAIQPSEYFDVGDITEFDYHGTVAAAFNNNALGSLKNLKTALKTPSDIAVVFVDNHDTERAGWGSLNYEAGDTYYLANVFMLTYGYGRPLLNSSYIDVGANDTPPSDAAGKTLDTNCDSEQWICQHRDERTLAALGLNEVFEDANVTNWATLASGRAISFSRGGFGHVIINNGSTELAVEGVTTDLEPGTYQDVFSGGTFEVSADKTITTTLAPQTALGTHYLLREGGPTTPPELGDEAAPVTVTFTHSGTVSYPGEYFVTGNAAALGSWDTSLGVPVSTAVSGFQATNLYPSVELMPGEYEIKMYRKDANGNIVWSYGENAILTVPEGYSNLSVEIFWNGYNGRTTIIDNTTSADIEGFTLIAPAGSNAVFPLCQVGFADCNGGYVQSFSPQEANFNTGSSDNGGLLGRYDPALAPIFTPRYFFSATFGDIGSNKDGVKLFPRVTSNQFGVCEANNITGEYVTLETGLEALGIVVTCDDIELDPNTPITDEYTLDLVDESGVVVATVDATRQMGGYSSKAKKDALVDPGEISFITEVCQIEGAGKCDTDEPMGEGGWQRFAVAPTGETNQVRDVRVLVQNATGQDATYANTFGLYMLENIYDHVSVSSSSFGDNNRLKTAGDGNILPIKAGQTILGAAWEGVELSFAGVIGQESNRSSALMTPQKMYYSGHDYYLTYNHSNLAYMQPSTTKKSVKIEFCSGGCGEGATWTDTLSVPRGTPAKARVTFAGEGIFGVVGSRFGVVKLDEGNVFSGMVPWGDTSSFQVFDLDTSSMGEHLVDATSFVRGIPRTSSNGFPGSQKTLATFQVTEPETTPIAPTLVPAGQCEALGSVIVPEVEGVEYQTITVGNVVTVIAKPAAGFVFAEGTQTVWVFDISGEECPPEVVEPPTEVTPVAPTLVPSDQCDVDSTFTIPEVEGVEYQVFTLGKTVVVTAKPAEGYVFAEGTQTMWVFDLSPAEECEVPQSPEPPVQPQSPEPQSPEPQSPEVTKPPAGGLAQTGANGVWLLGGALALLAGGAGLALSKRPRNS